VNVYDVWLDMSNGDMEASDVVTVRADSYDEAEEKAIRKRQNWLGYDTKVEVTGIASNYEH
jgi:hypothetical protein